MTAAAIQHCCRLRFRPRPRRRGQTREAEAKRHKAEAEAKAWTHEAEVKAEAVNFGLEAEARPRGLTSLGFNGLFAPQDHSKEGFHRWSHLRHFHTGPRRP